MAVDSTGDDRQEEVNCFTCSGNPVKFRVYTPRYGHAGEPLSIGSCIEPHSVGSFWLKALEGAKLFLIKPFDKEKASYSIADDAGEGRRSSTAVTFEETKLEKSRQIYHYCGFARPDFGDSIGNTIYVCKNCVENVDSSLFGLLGKLDNVFCQKLDEKAYRLAFLTMRRLRPIQSRTLRTIQKRWRCVPWHDKKEMKYLLNQLLKNFVNADPKRARATLEYFLKPLQKLLS